MLHCGVHKGESTLKICMFYYFILRIKRQFYNFEIFNTKKWNAQYLEYLIFSTGCDFPVLPHLRSVLFDSGDCHVHKTSLRLLFLCDMLNELWPWRDSHGLQQYSKRLWHSNNQNKLIGINRPNVCNKNISNTITPPPPARTIDTRQVRSIDSCCWCQILKFQAIYNLLLIYTPVQTHCKIMQVNSCSYLVQKVANYRKKIMQAY